MTSETSKYPLGACGLEKDEEQRGKRGGNLLSLLGVSAQACPLLFASLELVRPYKQGREAHCASPLASVLPSS